MKEKREKRIILKVGDLGTYVGEAGSTFTQAVKSAARDLGLDMKHWDVSQIPIKETRGNVTYTVSRKGQEPETVKITMSYGSTVIGTDEVKMTTPYGFDVKKKRTKAKKQEPVDLRQKMADAVAALNKFKALPPAKDLILKLHRKELIDALKIVVDVANGRISPVLSNAFIKAQGTECLIAGTDLERSYYKKIGCLGDPVTVLIPAKLLFDEVKALPADISLVELTFTDEKVKVNGRCELFTGDPEEFPEFPIDEIAQVEPLQVRGLVEALKHVLPAISTDETRYVLMNALVDLKQGKVVATDGFRLHIEDIVSDQDGTALIPLQTVKLLIKHKAMDAVKLAEKHMAFSVDGGTFLSRRADGNFPDYANVIPNHGRTVEVGATELLTALEGAQPLADGETSKPVCITINSGLEVTSARDSGAFKWEIPYHLEGKAYPSPVKFCFNVKFLMDALKSFPADRVTLETGVDYGACLINRKAVVMPIRL